MALKSTIIKTQISLSDMDKHVYETLSATVAQHPSENEQRLMIRILAYALNYQDRLEFTKGLCADDEPEIWLKDFSEDIQLWIDLGLPDEKRIKKACNRAKQVILYCYGENNQAIWWQKNQPKLYQFDNLQVVSLPFEATSQLADMAKRSIDLTITVQDGDIWVSDEQTSVQITPVIWQ